MSYLVKKNSEASSVQWPMNGWAGELTETAVGTLQTFY